MRGMKDNFQVMQPLISSRADYSGGDNRSDFITVSSRQKGAGAQTMLMRPPIPAGCKVYRCSVWSCAPMVTRVALKRSWRQIPFTLDETNQAASAGPSRSVGASSTGLSQGFGGSLVSSPKAIHNLSCPDHCRFKGGNTQLE
jgi:hypothetical protein